MHEQNLRIDDESISADGAQNFFRYVEQSKAAVNNRVVFPSGKGAKVINPRAKPMQLNPPK